VQRMPCRILSSVTDISLPRGNARSSPRLRSAESVITGHCINRSCIACKMQSQRAALTVRDPSPSALPLLQADSYRIPVREPKSNPQRRMSGGDFKPSVTLQSGHPAKPVVITEVIHRNRQRDTLTDLWFRDTAEMQVC
jgi:hypothetical protein